MCSTGSPSPILCSLYLGVRRVDDLDAGTVRADGVGSRAGEHRVRCGTRWGVECPDEAGRVLGTGWHGRVNGRGLESMSDASSSICSQ